MPTDKAPIPRQGDDSAAALASAIGMALSWWESSEDILLSLYKHLCGELEALAIATYVVSPRGARARMMTLAFKRYPWRISEDEITTIIDASKKLDRLASQRNKIAHGFICEFTAHEGDNVTASGNYLMSSFDKGEFHERHPQYALTTSEIEEFVKAVRVERARVMDVSFAVFERMSSATNGLSGIEQDIIRVVHKIATGEIPAQQVSKYLNWAQP